MAAAWARLQVLNENEGINEKSESTLHSAIVISDFDLVGSKTSG